MKVKNLGFSAKRTLNLVVDEKVHTSPRRIFIAVFVGAVAVALVGKFGVYDRYQAITDAQNELSDAQEQYLALLTQDADYNDVVAEYNRYSFGGMTDEEKAVADRDQVLTLIEQDLIPSANVESADLTGNQLSVQMSGITLTQASAIVQTLDDSDLVQSVSIYSANTADENAASTAEAGDKAATVTMTITLADNPEAASEAGSTASSEAAAGSAASSAAAKGGQ